MQTYEQKQIQILIPSRDRIFKVYFLHLNLVVTKSGRFSPAFLAFSAINIHFHKLDGEMNLKLQNEPFNILYYCRNFVRRNKFQKDKFPHSNLSSSEVPRFQKDKFPHSNLSSSEVPWFQKDKFPHSNLSSSEVPWLQKDKFPHSNLSSFEVPWFRDHAVIRDRSQGKVTEAVRTLTFIGIPTIMTEHFYEFS